MIQESEEKDNLRNWRFSCFIYAINHSVSASSSSQFLPILPFGIVVCTFTPHSDNLSQNSCTQTTKTTPTTTAIIITTKNYRNPSYQLRLQQDYAWRLPWRSPDWQRTEDNIRKWFIETSILTREYVIIESREFKAPSTLIRFQTKTELFYSALKKICVHTYRFRIVFARPHYNAVSVLKTLLYLSAHAQMNSTHAHFNISAREIGAILDSLLLSVVVVLNSLIFSF